MSKKSRTIKTRVVWGFCFFAFITSLLFSFFNFIFAYTVEDEFFRRIVQDEANYINQYYEQNGQFPAPRQSLFTIHTSPDTLPSDFREIYLEEPQRKEFAGADERHYHLLTVETEPQYILVAEISDILVVRPLREGIMIFLAICSGIMLVIAGAFGYWTAARTTRPLTRLAELIGGSKPETLPRHFAQDYPKNEIGILASSLEQAMQRIAEFIDREQHFTRDASHELRTPISVIKGACELLENKDLDDNTREMLNRIGRACAGMEQTVETLLLLAREAQAQPERQSTRLLPEVEQAILNNSSQLNHKDVTIDIDVDESLTLPLNQPVLSIILSNLIGNAFQYTSEGKVTVSSTPTLLKITDTGSGIDESIRDVAVQAMVKGQKSKGFGIGLSIVNRLCEKYHLNLHIESDNQGTSVSVEFKD